MKKILFTLGSLALLTSSLLFADEESQLNHGMQNTLLAQGNGSGVKHQYRYQKKHMYQGANSQGQGGMSGKNQDPGNMSGRNQGQGDMSEKGKGQGNMSGNGGNAQSGISGKGQGGQNKGSGMQGGGGNKGGGGSSKGGKR